VAWNRGDATGCFVDVNRVTTALPKNAATVMAEVSFEIASLHKAGL
jgi:hypothetical protein